MKKLILFSLPRSRRFFTSLFVSVVQGLSAVALLATSAWLISRASEQPPIMYLSIAIVGVRTFALSRASLRYAERWLSHDSVLQETSERRARVFGSLIDLAPAGLGRQSAADLGTRVVADTDEMQNLGLRIVSPLVQSVVVSVISTIVFAVMLPSAALVMGLLLATAFVVALPLSALIARRADLQSATERAQLATKTQRLLGNLELLNAYGWATAAVGEIEKTQASLAKSARRQAISLGFAQATFSFGAAASAVIAAVIGASEIASGHGDRVMLAVFALLPLAVFDVASAAQPVIGVWRRYRASAERLIEVIDRDIPAELTFEGTQVLGELDAVQLIAAEAGYPGNESVITNFSLNIKKGETIALVGQSGAGKSTVALILARLLNLRGGELRLNGQSADDFSTSSIQKRVGYLEQNAVMFNASVRVNLQIAKPEATDDELVAVLQSVSLWSMFSKRDGLDTRVGERGVLISGGEAQRLALARALLANFNLFILDEPTANVDEAQSVQLVSDFIAIAKDNQRMMVLITHDSTLAKLADRKVEI
ncbi:MAG: thiol reductant ABC exporter subunit CydC [Rhodoluna sp.]|nr:thiol reductant ABC exporter subunit CydC [Rhodoluna sp.]MBP6186154.1 thiol reductant ABC exporter subunit CydC [Rhodoluna sp.]